MKKRTLLTVLLALIATVSCVFGLVACKKDKTVAVTEVTISAKTLSLTEGDSKQLTATVSPDDATDKSVSWSSSNDAVATVSTNGTVTAIKEGTANITVTTTDGNKTATCEVTVTAKDVGETVHVTDVSVSPTILTLKEEETYELTATVSPDNATDKSVSWSSSNDAVATVSTDGTVTAIKAGTANITATTTDGNKTASCEVTVTAKSESIYVNGFNIKAIDNNNNPVANAYFNIGFYDSSSFNDSYLTRSGTITSNRASAALLKTDEDGIAALEVEVNAGTAYKLYIADPTFISSGGATPAIPKGYTANFGTNIFGMELTTVDFTQVDDGIYSATAKYKLDNSWGALFEPDNNLIYNRYYPDFYKDELTVEYTPYEKNAHAGQQNYFTFAPYRAPMPTEDADQSLVVQVTAKGRAAASGRYRISWTASDPTANILLNLYSFGGGNYFQRNDDGSPSETYVVMHTGDTPTVSETELQALYKLYKALYEGEAQAYDIWRTSYLNSFSGTNSINLELSSDTSTTVYSFGFVASKNCKVTISVERIGDAAIWTTQEVTVNMPAGEPKAQDQDGRVIDVPLSADTVVVQGDDGYYHLGSKNGAIIYVQLNKPTRANTTYSLVYLSDASNTDGRPQFVIIVDEYDEASNTGVHYYNNYGKVVSGYGALANSDGLYPVNDLLRTILEDFCLGMLDRFQYGENYWLAACQYYGKVSDGTEDNPYDLIEGNNRITLSSGSAWVAFTPTETGYYEFNYNVPGSVFARDKYYVSLEAQTEFKFEIEGAGTTVSLTVSSIPDNRHLRYYVSDTNDTQIWHGTEEVPLNLSNLLVYMVTIDHSAYNSALTVSIKLPLSSLNGNYIIHVAGSDNYSIQIKVTDGYVDYDGTAIALTSSTATLIQLDSEKANDTFFIWLEKVA